MQLPESSRRVSALQCPGASASFRTQSPGTERQCAVVKIKPGRLPAFPARGMLDANCHKNQGCYSYMRYGFVLRSSWTTKLRQDTIKRRRLACCGTKEVGVRFSFHNFGRGFEAALRAKTCRFGVDLADMASKAKDALSEVDDILAELEFDVDDMPKAEKKIAKPAVGASHTPSPATTPSSATRTKDSSNLPLSAALQRVRQGGSTLDLSHWSVRLKEADCVALSDCLLDPDLQLTTVLLNSSDIGAKSATALSKALMANAT
eukprot:2307033-Rhodomonas_salina.2